MAHLPPGGPGGHAHPAAAEAAEAARRWAAVDDEGAGTKVVLLGTSGGPTPIAYRSGISQAVIVGGRAYVVDCGNGVARQLARSGCSLARVSDVFLTHLHSDHDADYFTFFLLGWKWIQEGVRRRQAPVHAWGPGPAGGLDALPPDQPGSPPWPVVNPDDPTPGLVAITDHQLRAHAYDINIRMRDSGHLDLSTLFVPHEIALPPGLEACGPDRVAPPMEPISVMEDDRVRVSAILVEHPPVFPSFAFRFDTDQGSIVLSGDTRPTPNLVRLARGADILVHEVMDPDFGRQVAEASPGLKDQTGWDAMTRHMYRSHTSRDDVGKVAAEAGVAKLVLTHFIPPGPLVGDDRWASGPAAHFDGEIVVGHDLLEVVL